MVPPVGAGPGKFTVDMNTIRVTASPSEPIPIKNLSEHLKTACFFNMEKYPSSEFEILTVKSISGTV
ncbi:YceI family protein [Gillisia sp. Q332]|uniref:YceI family protein n=1 Tax=Gillisia xinjiangensis TaxID=3384765 RepID=UPI00391C1BFA